VNHEIEPDRLDAVLDGSERAETQAERDMLALAASLKESSPRAGEALRERVRGLARQAPQPGPARARRRLRAAAPAMAALAIGIVGVVVITNDRSSDQAAAPATESAPTALSREAVPQTGTVADAGVEAAGAPAPSIEAGPPTITIPLGTLAERQARARRLVTDAGGSVTLIAQPGTPPTVLLSARVPAARRSEVSAALLGLGEGPTRLAADADGALRLLLSERPSP
jgi:hypothetical protein